MLDVIVTLLNEALQKIMEVSVDQVLSRGSEKRKAAIMLLELYDAILVVEESSRSALNLFQDYYNGATPLRTRTRRAMDALASSVELLDKRLSAVYTLLHIFSPYLATVAKNEILGKVHTIEVVNAMLAAVPYVKRNGRHPSDFIIVPTSRPGPALAQIVHVTGSHEDIDRRVAEMKKEIDRSLKKKEINFTLREDLALILRDGDAALKRIQVVQKDLAEFIRRNVPFTDIL